MGRFDSTAGLIIELLLLKCGDLRLGQNNADLRHLGFQGPEPGVEVGQAMA
jgi:hypothetical protein